MTFEMPFVFLLMLNGPATMLAYNKPYSARHRGWLLANTLPYGVRTFLSFLTKAAIA